MNSSKKQKSVLCYGLKISCKFCTFSALQSTLAPSPGVTAATVSKLSCNFEQGLCQYTQDTTEQFNWKRQGGRTSSAGTGPSADHTYGTNSGK